MYKLSTRVLLHSMPFDLYNGLPENSNRTCYFMENYLRCRKYRVCNYIFKYCILRKKEIRWGIFTCSTLIGWIRMVIYLMRVGRTWIAWRWFYQRIWILAIYFIFARWTNYFKLYSVYNCYLLNYHNCFEFFRENDQETIWNSKYLFIYFMNTYVFIKS